jgi:hypothetical protein
MLALIVLSSITKITRNGLNGAMFITQSHQVKEIDFASTSTDASTEVTFAVGASSSGVTTK